MHHTHTYVTYTYIHYICTYIKCICIYRLGYLHTYVFKAVGNDKAGMTFAIPLFLQDF